ncbi:MAG: ATP-binding cassette domain-containing protein [Alphaproteobacteria bacterium]|nr:ATP-binding cassette domain-containing protein [Alphaproteobacteria bacterium]
MAWSTPAGREVLHDVDLTLHAGELVGLEGPSGAGKSTLLRCLVLLEPRARGLVRWRGEEVDPTTVLAFRQAVRWIPQRPAMLTPTVGEELALARSLAPSPLPPQAVDALREDLGLTDLTDDTPTARLSGGEQQRLALLRGLVGRPEVLLLDEPTAALDPARRDAVEALVAAHVREGGAALWVSHDAAQRTRLASRTVTLPAGRAA